MNYSKQITEYTHKLVIEMIDGLTLDYKQNIENVITIAGCQIDEANIKNITVLNNNTAKAYVIK